MTKPNLTISKPLPRVFKRLFDIVFSISFLFILIPLFLILFVFIKKDGGPIFYGHERVGKNGIKFKCLKFRSMSVHSESLLQELLDTDPVAKLEWESTFKLKNDPRVTKVGHFIRRTSLDEIPQLFNILKGEMSAVGPRPITEKELSMYEDKIQFYLMTKPGLTGLWQVSGRSDTDYNTRVSLDTNYIKNWSFINDIKILFKTVKVVFNKDGAY